MKASIGLFPRSDYRQDILTFKTTSDPDAIISKDGNLVYQWNNPKEKILKFDDVMSPPYDIISEEMQNKLYEKNPYNYVRLILGKQNKEDRGPGYTNQRS